MHDQDTYARTRAPDTYRESGAHEASDAGSKAAVAADTAKETAKDQARTVAGTAKQEAGAVVDEARSQVRRIASQARDQATDRVRGQHNQLVDRLRGLADEFQEMGADGRHARPGAGRRSRAAGSPGGGLPGRPWPGGAPVGGDRLRAAPSTGVSRRRGGGRLPRRTSRQERVEGAVRRRHGAVRRLPVDERHPVGVLCGQWPDALGGRGVRAGGRGSVRLRPRRRAGDPGRAAGEPRRPPVMPSDDPARAARAARRRAAMTTGYDPEWSAGTASRPGPATTSRSGT